MRLNVFGVWIILSSILKCVSNQYTECLDVLTQVTVEIPPVLLSMICQDNTPARIIIASSSGFWINNIDDLCTSFDINIGTTNMNYVATSQSLTIQILKFGQTLDAARIASVSPEVPGTHLVTVWGHQNTRFVLKVITECYDDGSGTTDDPIIIFPPVETTTQGNDGTTRQYNTKPRINSNAATKPQPTSYTPGSNHNTLNNSISPTPTKNPNPSQQTSSSFVVNILYPETTSGSVNSLALAKLEWMESKRLEFEEKLKSYRATQTDNKNYEETSTNIFIQTQTYLPFNTLIPNIKEIVSISESYHIPNLINSSIPVPSYESKINPSLTNGFHASYNKQFTTSRKELPFTLVENNPAHSTGPAEFFPHQDDYKSSSILTTNTISIPYTSSITVKNYDSITPTHAIESTAMSTQQSTHTESTSVMNRVKVSPTPIHNNALDKNTQSDATTLFPSTSLEDFVGSSTTITYYSTPPLSDNTLNKSSYFDQIKIGTSSIEASSTSDLSNDYTSVTDTTDISTSESDLKEDDDGDIAGETFWPVVAALVVGIPSVVVFGIAIIVMHRRRQPGTRKIFSMRSFSNMSSLSATPEYISKVPTPAPKHIARNSRV